MSEKKYKVHGMSPARKVIEPDTTTYGGRVALHLIHLRLRQKWSVVEAAERYGMPVANLYAYERGKAAGGSDLPMALLPQIAAAYGYKDTRRVLPST